MKIKKFTAQLFQSLKADWIFFIIATGLLVFELYLYSLVYPSLKEEGGVFLVLISIPAFIIFYIYSVLSIGWLQMVFDPILKFYENFFYYLKELRTIKFKEWHTSDWIYLIVGFGSLIFVVKILISLII